MTLSRSLVGRISFWWAAGFVVLALNWLRAEYGPPDTSVLAIGPAHADRFYMQLHSVLFIILGGAFACLAGAYFALEQFRRGRRRRWLGGLHFVATAAGVAAMSTPFVLATFIALPNGEPELDRTIEAWGSIVGAGYGLTLLAQLFFVAVLLDALRRQPDPR